MKYIAVYKSLSGTKLKGLQKKLKCSELFAKGLVVSFWLWADDYAEEDGTLVNIDLEDIEAALYPLMRGDKVSSKAAVYALLDDGWIDNRGDYLAIHEWQEWQAEVRNQQFLAEEEKRRELEIRNNNTERVRKWREDQKKKKSTKDNFEELTLSNLIGKTDCDQNDEPVPITVPKKKAEPEKIKIAEFVRLTKTELEKLEERYGKEFTQACIEKLDNYKGAKGATYKSDYRAILSWVVEEVKKTRPALVRRVPLEPDGENPFRKMK